MGHTRPSLCICRKRACRKMAPSDEGASAGQVPGACSTAFHSKCKLLLKTFEKTFEDSGRLGSVWLLPCSHGTTGCRLDLRAGGCRLDLHAWAHVCTPQTQCAYTMPQAQCKRWEQLTTSHNHMSHNFIGHNYIGHNYTGQTIEALNI